MNGENVTVLISLSHKALEIQEDLYDEKRSHRVTRNQLSEEKAAHVKTRERKDELIYELRHYEQKYEPLLGTVSILIPLLEALKLEGEPLLRLGQLTKARNHITGQTEEN